MFFDEIPSDCSCAGCTSPARDGRITHGASSHRRIAGSAVAAAVGVAALMGAGAGTAAAEPAPNHAGWDGSKYWFKDSSGGWRWTRHYDKYQQHLASSSSKPRSTSSSSARQSEPVFRGKRGWDAKDRVYWFTSGGHWYWTSHKSKYLKRTSTGSSSSRAGTSGQGGGQNSQGQTASRGWTVPVQGYVLTGYYGQRGGWAKGYHTGTDFAVPTGTAVRAVGSGRVVSAGYNGAYGYEIVIRHSDGRYTQYAHLSRIQTSVGQFVSAGQQIARSGATGNVTGPHLHFEVRNTPYFGSDMNPLSYLRSHGVRI
ncbi:M23 family metallopeptidase [Streptomyces sp. N35]|uniref:M23 family metallopeptidase n=1 Tax=Streptomyces sp. N35 TaxID=2795730 RepID=UPI0027DB122A|nr:M23 family metallopeptidase [Streptomyces sp. N35]